jgi:cytochrome oxidase Cu insertion factor (SCO1/SenC/PrrC family)
MTERRHFAVGRRPTRRWGCAISLALAYVLAGQGQSVGEQPSSAAPLMDDLMWGRGPIGGPFTLTDHTGRQRADVEFRAKLLLVYFGYTYCPDICPTDLMAITDALAQLGPAAQSIQPIFITVDPERDTLDRLAYYVTAFHPSLIALTGTVEQVRAVATTFKAWFAKVEPPTGAGYTVDHTAFIYIVGKDGRYAGFLPPSTSADRIAEVVRNKLNTPGN